MKKSEKKAHQEQLAAELRKQQEEERLAFIAATKERRASFDQANVELAEKDDREQKVRDVVLKRVAEIFRESTTKKMEHEKMLKKEQEWLVYLTVGGAPDPRRPPQLSSALHRWRSQPAQDPHFTLARNRDQDLEPILKVLDEVIKYPEDITAKQLKIFREVREEVTGEGWRTLEVCTRTWAGLARVGSVPTRHTHKSSTHALAVCLNEAPSGPIELDFPEMGVTITLPDKNPWRGSLLRALWLREDRLSAEDPRQVDPQLPQNEHDLYTFIRDEYDKVVMMREQQLKDRKAFFAKTKTRINQLNHLVTEDRLGVLKNERAELDQLTGSEPELVLLPRDILINQEAELYSTLVEGMRVSLSPGEVSLRSHRPCGGVLDLRLLLQPPRAKCMRGDITLTMVESSEALTPLVWQEVYNPPPPPAAGAVRAPEEIEADIRRQEAALDRLILLHIQLPETVLWLEPPIVCCWDAGSKSWTTSDIHDLKYNEDKFTVTFRTGSLRPIGFATPKYCNLPYQGWELKPNADQSGVIVTIMGAVVVSEVEVLEEGIIVRSIQNGATAALQDMLGQLVTLRQLIGRFQAGGVDFFPCEDTPNLLEGSCPKLRVLEDHLYHCMAHLCTAYNFQWSRWNVSAGRRAIVQQTREHSNVPESADQERAMFDILHVTPLQAALVTATEVSAEYCTTPLEGLAFYPDLYSLIEGHGSQEAKALMGSISWKLVEGVKDLLCAVRPCSYS